MIGTEQPVEPVLMPEVANDGKIVPAHYDSGRKSYWTTNSRGGWIEITEPSLRKILRSAGFYNKPNKGDYLSQVDQKIKEIFTEQDVDYAGPLAGYNSGLIRRCGNRLLVTSSPKLIQPQEGEWPVLQTFFERLLVDGRYDQRPFFFAWLKIAYDSIRRGIWHPGQVLGLAGVRNSGKSLNQALITEVLGGRSAKPYRYMSGRTDFNADLFGAEHLMIEDEHSSTDIRARRQFGAQIKQFTVNETQSCHGKGRQALTLPPLWRVSISVNEEPEAMMVLPPMSDSEHDSVADKLFLLRAMKAEMPMPTVTHDQRHAFWKRMMSELPAFIHFLLNWDIPEELRDGRFGIKTWHHPKLLAALDELAPETRLLALADQVCFGEEGIVDMKLVMRTEWSGTAEQLERRLFDSIFAAEARRLLSYPTACGVYLGRLAGRRQSRVKQLRTATARKWLILKQPEGAPT